MTFQAPTGKRPPLREFLADPTWSLAVVAHRGAWHGAPENSIASVELAIRQGYEFVEIDVQATVDGKLVCLHDDTLERMTGHPGTVAGLTAGEITGLALKEGAGGPDAPLTEEHAPLLGDLLDATGCRIYVDVDVKHLRDLGKVADYVKAHPCRHHINLKTMVTGETDLQLVDDLETATGVLVKPVFLATAETLGTYLDMLRRRPTPLVEGLFDTFASFDIYARAARQAGTDVFLNTLDAVPSAEVTDTASLADPATGWGRLIKHGARLLQTDRPDVLKAYGTSQA